MLFDDDLLRLPQDTEEEEQREQEASNQRFADDEAAGDSA